MKRLCLLGATGSIGSSTLDLVRQHPGALQVSALTAHRNYRELARLCAEFGPELAVIADRELHQPAADALAATGSRTRLLSGPAALSEAAVLASVDTVVAGIVGAAGLEPTLAAVRGGRRVLLANKEALVMTGDLFMQAARESGALLMPVDSEHNAIFQCLPSPQTGGRAPAGLSSITLTASGGPFRTWSKEEMRKATPEAACNHPTWSMGRKISVDSATLMNKGLEVIEAHFLFGLPPECIHVLVHPESLVHGLASYDDGSTLAQMGRPDMRTPLASGLFWPERRSAGVAPLDLAGAGALHFEQPDLDRFPCLELARRALAMGGTAPAVLNAANESAVQFFLEGRIGFMDIPRMNEKALVAIDPVPAADLETVLAADRNCRQLVAQWVV